MPISAPEGPTATMWEIRADSVDRVGSYPVTLLIKATTDDPANPAMAPIVQQAVDVLEQSGRFRVLSAGRTLSYTESMTPTESAPTEV
ncbi:hypothetical protein ABTZ57_16175 [Streptomyces sp. NPDC094048]|uniref:hypothetical protein n=1 Tax=Streptomyces sp. NPDC094048 TaxID=3155207 RepID=UPI0033180947